MRFEGREAEVAPDLKARTGEYQFVKNMVSYHLANPPPPPLQDIKKQIYKIFGDEGVSKEAVDKKLESFAGREEDLLKLVHKLGTDSPLVN